MIKIIIGSWILLSIVNLLYDYITNIIEQNIHDIMVETNHFWNRKVAIIFYIIVSTIISPYHFFFQTVPNIFIDILNFSRFIKYKIITQKRKKRKII